MEFCDLTGDTDFDYFNPCFGRNSASSIPNPINILDDQFNYFNVENERLLLDNKLGKILPLLSELDDNSQFKDGHCHCKHNESTVAAETSLSQEFPPQYPKLEVRDPFRFLKSQSRSTGESRRNDVTSFSQKESKPNVSCNHDEPTVSRRYMVSFDRNHSVADRSDHCYAAERSRCVDFWEFVNSTLELTKVIKEGKFEYSVQPNIIHCVFPGDNKESKQPPQLNRSAVNVKKPAKYTPEMKALRQRNEGFRKDIKQLQEVLHERVTHIKRKSGQLSLATALVPLRRLPKVPSETTICGRFADCIKPDVDDIFAEMELFDEISQNPVRTRCDLQKRKVPCIVDYTPFYGEGNNSILEEEGIAEAVNEIKYNDSSYFGVGESTMQLSSENSSDSLI